MLTHKQEAVLAALLTTPTLADAAKGAGVGERTVYRWMKEPDFKAALRDARRKVYGEAMARLQQIANKGAAVLESIINDDDAAAGARVSAYRTALEFGARWIELDDLAARVEDLEGRMGPGGGDGPG